KQEELHHRGRPSSGGCEWGGCRIDAGVGETPRWAARFPCYVPPPMPMPPTTRSAAQKGATLPPEAYAPLPDALPGARPEDAQWIGSGWGASAFLVPAADGDWVARIPSDVPWSVEDLEREVRM